MRDWLVYLNPILAGLAAIFAALVFFRRARVVAPDGLVQEKISQLVRMEFERVRQSADDHARNLRQELNTNLRGFQETTLRAFRELGETLANQVKEFGNHLDNGLKGMDERTAAIRTKLDTDIAHMGTEAIRQRDALRQTIEIKLDDAATKQASASKDAAKRSSVASAAWQRGSGNAGTCRRTAERAFGERDQIARFPR